MLVRDKTINRNMPVLGIFSPCLKVKRADVADKLPDVSYRLLRANERVNFASYALIESEDDIMVVASFETLPHRRDGGSFGCRSLRSQVG